MKSANEMEPGAAGGLVFADAAIRYIRSTFLKSSVDWLLQTEDGYRERLDRGIALLARATHTGADKIAELLTPAIAYTLEYLKEQSRFQRAGRYRRSDFEEVRREVYDNRELMAAMYLPGLYLTQLLWPIHYRVGKEFRRLLLPRLARGMLYLEAGVGPGHTLVEVLESRPGISAVAVDISPHSLEFADKLLKASGAAPGGVSFLREDLAQDFRLEPKASAASLGEVLEHVGEPGRVLSNLSASLIPSAPAFITTVIDSSAIDHITHFTSCQEIDDIISAGGFRIVERHTISPSDLATGAVKNDPTKIYYGLFTKAQ